MSHHVGKLLILFFLLLLLCLLEPLDEWLHVLEEHVAALRVAALLVPVADGVLTNNVCSSSSKYKWFVQPSGWRASLC
jgi:hypothetical protein